LIDKSSPDEMMFLLNHFNDFTPAGWSLGASYWEIAQVSGALTPQAPK
jgi:hypothetical protein